MMLCKMLEMLRQPLEDKIGSISHSASSLTYPTNFTLIGSANPCPCGYYGDPQKECTCSIAMVKAYPQARKYPAR
jgi:magnesium chelatase family protein